MDFGVSMNAICDCEKKLTTVGGDRKLLLFRNAMQIKKIVEAKYPSLSFDVGNMQPGKVRAECDRSQVGHE